MKKIILYLFLIVFSLTANIGLQSSPKTNVFIGTDTLSSQYPFTTYWMDGRTDVIYLGSEITANGGVEGYITGIAFYVNHADTLTMHGFNVKMLNTTDTTLTGFGGGWNIAFSGNVQILNTGWNYIYFTQPFGWNGSDNIIFEFCYNNNSWTWFSTVRSTVKANKTYGAFVDLPSGDGCTDITTGTFQARRPNICLFIDPLTGISNNTVPVKYSLSQNYPNPFNPETKINYSLPKDGWVNLKVFDILGRQISELVSDYKKAGSYIVEFNASGLSSGVYYYKLTSGEFSEMKKMLLVK